MILGPSLNTQTTSSFRMIQDGLGGAIFTFRDNRELGGPSAFAKVWAQRVGWDGIPLWGNGTFVSVGPRTQDLAAPVSDGLGGVIVAWQDFRSGAHFDIWAQRIDVAGVLRWGLAGVVVCDAASNQLVPDIASDGNGGAIIAWSDSRVDANGDIYAQRVDYLGSAVWAANGVAQITGPSANNVGEYLIRMIPDGEGGAFLAFTDNRGFSGIPDPAATKVWAQRVKPSGFPDWGNGVAVGAGTGVHDHFQIVSDSEGGVVIVWQDGTLGAATNISAQRLGPTGGASWITGGVLVCSAPAAQSSPSVVPDGRGHAIAAWTDARFGPTDVFAQRVCVPNAMITGVAEDSSPKARPVLGAPAPNPTGDAVAYTISLSRAETVRVLLCDVQGRVVEKLVDRTLGAGEHTFAMSRSQMAHRLAGGVYFLTLISPETRASRKLVLLR